jgi:plasmid stabilization system protein ParE
MTSERPLAIRRSSKARADLLEIWLYIAERNPQRQTEFWMRLNTFVD